MLPIQIGLADSTGTIDPSDLSAAAAASNLQVTRDLPQYWNVSASVSFLPDTKNIPAGVWPVFLVKTLPQGEGGFHLTKHNQPFAEVIAALKAGENVILWPSGRLSRDDEHHDVQHGPSAADAGDVRHPHRPGRRGNDDLARLCL